jgi:hypothetical protein
MFYFLKHRKSNDESFLQGLQASAESFEVWR